MELIITHSMFASRLFCLICKNLHFFAIFSWQLILLTFFILFSYMYSIAMVAIYRLLVSYDTEAKQESHSNMSYYQSELGCCNYVERENVFQFS